MKTESAEIVHEFVTHGDGTETIGRREGGAQPSLLRRRESVMTFTQRRTSPTVAPTTTTAIGV